MREKPMEEMPLMKVDEGIVLFHPHVPETAISGVTDVLQTRWIGQGPKVDQFEQEFSNRFADNNKCVAVGAGTDALHLAYLLADIQPGDEIIVPVFTCTATNIPLLYMGAKIVFADVDPKTLNISVPHIKELVTDKTKAIVCVHYGGLPCDMDGINAIAKEHNLFVVEDAAHALGATYKGKNIGEISDFTMYSFQAIKSLTTGDGGLLTFKNEELYEKAKRLRWFGIDRSAKQKGVWENDIVEVGYKYQMNDIAAAIGLASLEEFEATLAHRQKLLDKYFELLKDVPGVTCIGEGYKDCTHAAWLFTVLVDDRIAFQKKLRDYNIESSQVHYRNDRYSVFGGRQSNFPNMDAIEDKYVVLPLHTKMGIKEVEYICDIIKKG